MRSPAPLQRTRAASAALLTACALALLPGCGSSGGSSSSSSSSSATSAAGASTAPTATSSLKVNTTPKFAAPSSSAPVQSGTVEVAYRNITISPDTLRVKVGSTIRWTNFDPVEHNVTSRGGTQRFASGNFGEGATFELKVTRPGLIHYTCTIHPTSMNGTIQVIR
jgi:plastocyanin